MTSCVMILWTVISNRLSWVRVFLLLKKIDTLTGICYKIISEFHVCKLKFILHIMVSLCPMHWKLRFSHHWWHHRLSGMSPVTKSWYHDNSRFSVFCWLAPDHQLMHDFQSCFLWMFTLLWSLIKQRASSISEGNRPCTSGFPSQRASDAGFDVFFDGNLRTLEQIVNLPVKSKWLLISFGIWKHVKC